MKLNLLFDTDHVYLPQRVGGSEVSIDGLARGLSARGHRVAVFAKLDPGGARGRLHRAARRLLRRPVADRAMGYKTYRSWNQERDRPLVHSRTGPDLVIFEGSDVLGRASALINEGRRGAIFLRHCEWRRLGGTPSGDDGIAYLANSKATAAAYKARFGIDAAVVRPIIEPANYRCTPVPAHVTFVNPVPEKGVEIALAAAAACPGIPFRFVRCWPRAAAERQALERRVADLANVTLTGPVADMRDIYRSTAFLLVPSQWFEAWGRVVGEAQISGIPAIGSDHGGLAEVIGRGGITLARTASPESWAEACRRLWTDDTLRASLGAEARSEAESEARRPELILDRFETFARSLLFGREGG